MFGKIMNSMAYAVFSTSILGFVLIYFGKKYGIEIFVDSGVIASGMLGVAIGISVSYVIGSKGFALVAGTIAGHIGYLYAATPSQALLAMIASLTVGYLCKFLHKKTSFDLFLLSIVSLLGSVFILNYVSGYVDVFIYFLIDLINSIASLNPILASILLAVICGFCSITPFLGLVFISGLNLSGFYLGVASIGVSCYMIGLALMAREENDVGFLTVSLLGTGMIYFVNVIRNVFILIPIFISIIVSCLMNYFVFEVIGSESSLLGFSGLIGQIEVVDLMGSYSLFGVVTLYIIIPMIVVLYCYDFMKKRFLILKTDFKLEKF